MFKDTITRVVLCQSSGLEVCVNGCHIPVSADDVSSSQGSENGGIHSFYSTLVHSSSSLPSFSFSSHTLHLFHSRSRPVGTLERTKINITATGFVGAPMLSNRMIWKTACSDLSPPDNLHALL